ncbi:MAG: ribosome-binding factor A, partial [Symbiobacteriaceae bacterium]|nr:ribosome-binding factor A [Symbiobacteriaceae bacterium]
SVLGSEEEIKNTWAGLQSSKGMIRSWLAQSMKLRTTPEIELALDDSIARGSRILELMKDFESETIPEDDPEYGSLGTDGDC